jgi:hypothetical protein
VEALGRLGWIGAIDNKVCLPRCVCVCMCVRACVNASVFRVVSTVLGGGVAV